MNKKFNVQKHILVSPHRILSEKEKKTLLSKYNISEFQLPVIKINDVIAKALDAKRGDIIEITRKEETGKYPYYRRVVE